MDKSSPTRMLSEKATTPSLKISIPSHPTTPEVRDSEETTAMGSLPDDENISPKDGTSSSSSSSSSSTTAFGLGKNVRMNGEDNETKKAQLAMISFNDQVEETTAPPNLSADSGLDNNKNVEMKDRENERKKGQVSVTSSFSELYNSPLPTKLTVPTSTSPLPPPRAYNLWYDDSDQPEEESKTAPTNNVSDTPQGDNTTTTTMESLLDSYLKLQSDTTDAAHPAPPSPSSDYSSSKDEKTNEEEDSDSNSDSDSEEDDWDDSLPGPYGVEDFLECLYDAYYLDEDMTSEIIG